MLLAQLVYAIGRLHKHGWVFGDLSFKNAAFALDPPRMMLLDCDGAASLTDQPRKQASTPFWDPPECSAGRRTVQRQDLQDTLTDVYKLGLAILRCLIPGKGVASTRNPDRLTGQLDAEGAALVTRALDEDRSGRPTAKEVYAYLYKVVSPQVNAPEVRDARLVTPLCPRGMDARVEWQIGNADEVTVTAGKAGPTPWTCPAPGGCLSGAGIRPGVHRGDEPFRGLPGGSGRHHALRSTGVGPSTPAACRDWRSRAWTRSPSST